MTDAPDNTEQDVTPMDVELPETQENEPQSINWGAVLRGATGALSDEAGKVMKRAGAGDMFAKARAQVASLTDGADEKAIDAAAKAISAATEKKRRAAKTAFFKRWRPYGPCYGACERIARRTHPS